MTKNIVAAYFKGENQSLGNFLHQYKRLKSWNIFLKESLTNNLILLDHCQIVGLDKNCLIVIADNPHWVIRFRCLIPELIVKLRNYEELKNIQAICCKARPLNYLATKTKKNRLIISNESASVIQETANKIKNGKLKEILERLAKITTDS